MEDIFVVEYLRLCLSPYSLRVIVPPLRTRAFVAGSNIVFKKAVHTGLGDKMNKTE